MIPTKEKNHFLENYRPFCGVCASNSLAQHCIIKKPVSRAGAFYFCKACEALSFHAESDAYAYGDDYYGCGNSKVGGLAHAIRCLSANWRADFVSKLVGKGHCLDIGCGDGEFLKAMYSRGWSIKGTELPGSACERAKKKLPGQIVCAAQFESAAEPGSCNLITIWKIRGRCSRDVAISLVTEESLGSAFPIQSLGRHSGVKVIGFTLILRGIFILKTCRLL
jgi:hypothetical protein